jgi:hypothetical protein
MRYKYKVIDGLMERSMTSADTLTEISERGWELVTVLDSARDGNLPPRRLFFFRQEIKNIKIDKPTAVQNAFQNIILDIDHPEEFSSGDEQLSLIRKRALEALELTERDK